MKFDLTVTRTETNALEMFRSAAHSPEAMTAGVARARAHPATNRNYIVARDSLIVYWVGCRRWFGLRRRCTGPEHAILQDRGDVGRREAIRKWNEMVTPGQITDQILGDYWYSSLEEIPTAPSDYEPAGIEEMR